MTIQKLRPSFAQAIADCIPATSLYIDEAGNKFSAVTQTDLMSAMRDKRWKVPTPNLFLSDVIGEGFIVRQGYQFPTKVRRYYPNHSGYKPPALSKYQTIILAKVQP